MVNFAWLEPMINSRDGWGAYFQLQWKDYISYEYFLPFANSNDKHFDENGTILTNDELVTTLSQFFLSVNEDVPPLDLHNLPAFLPAADQLPTIHPYQVCKKLLNLNPLTLFVPGVRWLSAPL